MFKNNTLERSTLEPRWERMWRRISGGSSKMEALGALAALEGQEAPGLLAAVAVGALAALAAAPVAAELLAAVVLLLLSMVAEMALVLG